MKVNKDKKGERYYLFEHTTHDDLNMDFQQETIARFIELWEGEISIQKISQILKIKIAEALLIMIDLDYSGKLPERQCHYSKGAQLSEMKKKELLGGIK